VPRSAKALRGGEWPKPELSTFLKEE